MSLPTLDEVVSALEQGLITSTQADRLFTILWVEAVVFGELVN